ncbi:MAG: DUF2007 domain-containing protein [Melioribacteraceae bacterium]
MICPNCESEYIDGIITCADCGIELIPEKEFEGNLITPADWVIAFTSMDPIEVDMLKANLEGADIECLILSQKDSSYNISNSNFSLVKLLVKKSDAKTAAEIINDINDRAEEDEEG